MKRVSLFLLALLCVVLLAPGLTLSQVSSGGYGAVIGRVTDASGAVVPSAVVTLTDEATRAVLSAQTNMAGLYAFSDVRPGNYDLAVSKSGFRKALVARQAVIVGTPLRINVRLEVGATTETVQVTTTPGAQLQTMNATMGTTLVGSAILNLPTANRDVASLLTFEPTAAPSFGGAVGNIMAGQVAGAQSDQNTILLNGGNNTDDLSGDNGYINNFSGSLKGTVPMPVEAVQEFRVNTNNMTSDFGASGGAEMLVETKRGTTQFHGSAYDYFNSQALDSNSWDNNWNGITKPISSANRFGADFGGPLLPKLLGGRTFGYFLYEGLRYPRTGPYYQQVPTAALRSGIITIGGTPYDVKGFDPRGIGIDPTVQKLWTQFEPLPTGNCSVNGDGVNTGCFQGTLTFPLSNNTGLARIDHAFGSKWSWNATYEYFEQFNPDTLQVDIGGLVPGDKLGVPASVSSTPSLPALFTTGLTGNLTPTMVNAAHFTFTRNDWSWNRVGALPEIHGIPAALEIGGEGASALQPIDMRTQDARKRMWQGHDYDLRDTLTWNKGSHLIQVGGDWLHQWLHFDRYDNVVGGLTQLTDNIGDGASISSSGTFGSPVLTIPAANVPAAISGPSETNAWDGYYAALLGMVYSSSIVATRTGKSLTLNPLGTPEHSYDRQDFVSLYASDAWKIKPDITINYGLNWAVQLPPVDANGEQTILVDPTTNKPITIETYLANELSAANAGQVYNPVLGFDPIGAVAGGMKYPYQKYYQWSPRVSVAWNPHWFGSSTVIRAGYARIYDRQNAINAISSTTLGDGFLQPAACTGVTTALACGGKTTDPASAFRIGIDGTSIPLALSQTLATPVEPGVNSATSNFTNTQDPVYQPGVSDEVDFSIQKQFKNNTVVELGYVGRWQKHLFLGIDFSNVPWMMKQGGQTFANAYDNLWRELSAGAAVTAQPFFETALKGSSYCSGAASCTAAVVANETADILSQSVSSIWSDLDSAGAWTAFSAPSIQSTRMGCFISCAYMATSDGYGNYQALVASIERRAANGLTVDGNFTYGHALGVNGLSQTYTAANPNNPWNLRTDYGPQYFDRKFTANILSSYVLPFGSGHRFSSRNSFVGRLISGWMVSPLFSASSGLPVAYYDGSFQEWGNGFNGTGASMIPLVNTANLSNGQHFGNFANATTGVATSNTNGRGAYGPNMFANPNQVFNDFRPPLVGLDGRTMEAGQLRGQARWSFDLGLTKDTAITERVHTQLYIQAFNVLNHMEYNNPSLSFTDAADFGQLDLASGVYQFNPLNGNGGPTNGNYTRVIMVGLRLSF